MSRKWPQSAAVPVPVLPLTLLDAVVAASGAGRPGSPRIALTETSQGHRGPAQEQEQEQLPGGHEPEPGAGSQEQAPLVTFSQRSGPPSTHSQSFSRHKNHVCSHPGFNRKQLKQVKRKRRLTKSAVLLNFRSWVGRAQEPKSSGTKESRNQRAQEPKSPGAEYESSGVSSSI